jgi:hypothetical protein
VDEASRWFQIVAPTCCRSLPQTRNHKPEAAHHRDRAIGFAGLGAWATGPFFAGPPLFLMRTTQFPFFTHKMLVPPLQPSSMVPPLHIRTSPLFRILASQPSLHIPTACLVVVADAGVDIDAAAAVRTAARTTRLAVGAVLQVNMIVSSSSRRAQLPFVGSGE